MAVWNPRIYAAEVQQWISTIKQVGPKGEGHAAATHAWNQLVKQDASQLLAILKGFDGANVLATNWLRAAVDTVAENEFQRSGKLPSDALRSFLLDSDNAPLARRSAYEWLLQVDPQSKESLLPHFLNDSSLELRREAVAQLLEKATATTDKDEAIKVYVKALGHARDLDQINDAAKQIQERGGDVDLPKHFGFLQNWDLIGPFNNANKSGYDKAYSPEQSLRLQQPHEGKDGEVQWKRHQNDDRFGIVDLNTVYPEKYKGAIAYAHTTFLSNSDQDVEIRLGCINGNKIWLNDKFLTGNHVYHAGMMIDQYIVKASLKKGLNHILLKVAQNEQEEEWAQRWQFQLRICDSNGTAILPVNKQAIKE